MYEIKVMHRDLKLDNILIHFPGYDEPTTEELLSMDLENEPFVVKLADLGYAREMTSKEDGRIKTFKGSPLMMAPEVFDRYWGNGEGYSHKIDVWAMGVLFYLMLTGMYMFSAENKGKRAATMEALH